MLVASLDAVVAFCLYLGARWGRSSEPPAYSLKIMQTSPVSPPPLWVTLFPGLLLLVFFALPSLIFMIFLARRKGTSLPLYILLAFIPGVNVISAIWLASLTDESIRAELAELRRRLDAKV
jgi:hypothetical protein